MAFKAKIVCDQQSCTNAKNLKAEHHSNVEAEIYGIAKSGKWLFDYMKDAHYCPYHAPKYAEEVGISYEL